MTASIHITSWLRAFFALQESAIDGRGVVEIPDGDDAVIRWPRTFVEDVVAITALLDRFVREQPLRFGGRGLARRWRACVDELAHHARVARMALTEYPENRTFWRALPALCIYLHARRAALPTRESWHALLSRFDLRRAPAADQRNCHV